MTRNASETFNEILVAALRLDVIDIFKVMHYQVNGIPSDQIVRDLESKVREQRALFVG